MRTNLVGQPDSLGSMVRKLVVSGVLVSGIVSSTTAIVIWVTTCWTTAISFFAGSGASIIALAGSLAFVGSTWRLSPHASLVAALAGFGLAFGSVIGFLYWIETKGRFEFIWVGAGLVVAAGCFAIAVVMTYRRLRMLVFSPPLDSDNDPC